MVTDIIAYFWLPYNANNLAGYKVLVQKKLGNPSLRYNSTAQSVT